MYVSEGTGPSISVSENDFHESSLSEASIELKQWNYTNSDNSIQSLKSIASIESQSEDDSLQFMRRFVDILFQNSAHLTLELKSEFGIKTRVSRLCLSIIQNIYLDYQTQIS